MTTDDTAQRTPHDEARDPRPDEAVKPRGNPETDHESVQKGEEQLDKVVGN